MIKPIRRYYIPKYDIQRLLVLAGRTSSAVTVYVRDDYWRSDVLPLPNPPAVDMGAPATLLWFDYKQDLACIQFDCPKGTGHTGQYDSGELNDGYYDRVKRGGIDISQEWGCMFIPSSAFDFKRMQTPAFEIQKMLKRKKSGGNVHLRPHSSRAMIANLIHDGYSITQISRILLIHKNVVGKHVSRLPLGIKQLLNTTSVQWTDRVCKYPGCTSLTDKYALGGAEAKYCYQHQTVTEPSEAFLNAPKKKTGRVRRVRPDERELYYHLMFNLVDQRGK